MVLESTLKGLSKLDAGTVNILRILKSHPSACSSDSAGASGPVLSSSLFTDRSPELYMSSSGTLTFFL